MIIKPDQHHLLLPGEEQKRDMGNGDSISSWGGRKKNFSHPFICKG
jgi:hypothetical protein